MSTVIEIELDGKKREVTQLDITAQAFGVGTGLVDDLVEKHPFITTNTKYVVKLAGKSHNLLVSATINLIQDKDKFRAVISTGAGWYTGELVGSATTALATAVAVAAGVASAPVVIVGIAVLGVSSGVVAGWYGSEKSKDIYDGIKEFFGNGSGKTNNTHIGVENGNTTISTTTSLQTFLENDDSLLTSFSENENWDVQATIPSVSNPDSFAEQLKYDADTKSATIKTQNQTTEVDATKTILQTTDAKKLTLNNQTYDISNLNALELRNAIDGIDSVSFLLSNILIKTGEQIDLGSKGIYTVKSKDTLSTIAQQNGYVTKDLVKLNPWLFDDGRIKFNYPDKVLIKEGTIISDNNNNTLTGDYNAQNILKDHNGGNDTLVGGSQADILDGGKGYDTYVTNNNDTISDSDGAGRVFFNGDKLEGGTWNKDKGVYEGDGGEYTQTTNGWTFTNSNGEKLYFNLDIKNALGIKLLKGDNTDQDFSSSLFNSNSYFDTVLTAKVNNIIACSLYGRLNKKVA